MADLKISQLTGATTPLAGTEVVPLVQSSTTKKVAVSDLTAGRQVALASAVAGTGLTPIAWSLNANSSFYQTGTISSFIGTAGIAGVGTEFIRNAYYDGSWKYVGAGTAGRYAQTGGQHIFYRAVSGTANAAVTWVQNLTISTADDVTANAGNFVLGAAGKGVTTSGALNLGLGTNGAVNAMIIANTTGAREFYNSYTNNSALNQGEGAFSWDNASSATIDLAVLFPDITFTNKGISVLFQAVSGQNSSSGTSYFWNINRTTGGTWSGANISTVGSNTITSVSGSGTSFTVNFSAANQYGNGLVRIIIRD